MINEEENSHTFIYYRENRDKFFEVRIERDQESTNVINFLVENYRLFDFITNDLIEGQAKSATGMWSICGYEKVITNELGCMNLYFYTIFIRDTQYPSEQGYYKEVDIMDFGLFLDYLDRN